MLQTVVEINRMPAGRSGCGIADANHNSQGLSPSSWCKFPVASWRRWTAISLVNANGLDAVAPFSAKTVEATLGNGHFD
jgi:hypothetical protein